jgi:hypothetical protein
VNSKDAAGGESVTLCGRGSVDYQDRQRYVGRRTAAQLPTYLYRRMMSRAAASM